MFQQIKSKQFFQTNFYNGKLNYAKYNYNIIRKLYNMTRMTAQEMSFKRTDFKNRHLNHTAAVNIASAFGDSTSILCNSGRNP
jgi:hypothetical protein